MALEGTLRDFSLADIFQLIGLQRKTGALTLRSSEDIVTVSFLDGKVVGAESEQKKLENRLGQVLLRSGMVSHHELEEALRSQMQTLERLGHVLVRLGTLTRDELARALEQQILQIIYRTFRWQDGDYQFSQETVIDYDAELVTPISAESILMEGARMLDEWPIIEKKIPRWDIVFIATAAARRAEVAEAEDLDSIDEFEFETEPTPPVEARDERIVISPVENEVLRLVDGSNSVDDIVRKSIFGEFETCKALYTMLVRSLIREATVPEILAADERRTLQTAAIPTRRPQFPAVLFLLVPLLAASLLLASHNPMNPMVGSGPKLLPRMMSAASAARMWNLWETLRARDVLTGSFPETLVELVREHLIAEDGVHDPWGRPYRYVLREDSVLLAGSLPGGAPDPNLILTRDLRAESQDLGSAPAVTLVHP